MTPLKLFALRLRFSLAEGAVPQHYLGSAWRGAFGHALKKLVCIFKRGVCEHCPLANSCAYTTIFESKWAVQSVRGTPSPYTLYPTVAQHELHLYMTIMGDMAMHHFPFMLHALRLAGEKGVGNRVFTFEAVEQFHEGVWQQLVSQPTALSIVPRQPCSASFTLRLITPVRFKHLNHFVTPSTMTLALWIRALRRRLISLAAAWGDASAMRQRCTIDAVDEWRSADLHWREMERYSSRQKSAMKMGGVVGSFDISAEHAEAFWSLLWMGQWTHVGKMTTMGLGRYEMVPLTEEEGR